MTSTRHPPSWGRWTLAVGAAEAGGIAAAAACLAVATVLVGEPDDAVEALVVLTAAALGGVVEGTLVGAVMHRLLSGWLPDLPRLPFVGATVAVAVTGWLLGNLPPVLLSTSAEEGAEVGAVAPAGPPLLVVAAAAAVGGAVAGALFGGAQALVLRRHVDRARRWVGANVLAWAAGVAVITVGASVVPGGWPVAALAAYGAGVGLLAGLAVGAVTGYALPGLQDLGPRALHRRDRWVLSLLRGPAHRVVSGSLLELRYLGPRTGAVHALPVQYAELDGALVVLVGHGEGKRWWRALHRLAEVDVLLRGRLRHGEARVLNPGEEGYLPARAAWTQRFARARPGPDDPVVLVRVDSRRTGPPSAHQPARAQPAQRLVEHPGSLAEGPADQ